MALIGPFLAFVRPAAGLLSGMGHAAGLQALQHASTDMLLIASFRPHTRSKPDKVPINKAYGNMHLGKWYAEDIRLCHHEPNVNTNACRKLLT